MIWILRQLSRKAISHKLSDGSIGDLYLRCTTNLVNNSVQTQATHFMDLRLLAIKKLDGSGVIGTPATRIHRPTDGYHCSPTDQVFGEETAVRMSASKSDHDYK